MPEQSDLPERILDQALVLAEAGSWEALRLRAVAASMHISLDNVRRCYRQKDDLVEAWFDRADRAVLAQAPTAAFFELPAPERIHQVIMAWLGVLAPHRRLTRQMLSYKLEPGHIHLQVLGILRISRTVQWFREAAGLEATGCSRILEELALTSVYLTTFCRWMFDDSPDSRDSRALLRCLLSRWQQCANLTGGAGPRTHRDSGTGQASNPAEMPQSGR